MIQNSTGSVAKKCKTWFILSGRTVHHSHGAPHMPQQLNDQLIGFDAQLTEIRQT